MTEPGAQCRLHPAVAATFTCPRCGNFGCVDCERRTDANAAPLCPSCWALQLGAATPSEAQSTAWQTAGLILGCASIIPCCAIAVPGIVVNIIAIVKAKEGAARAARWKPVVGLVVSSIMLLIDLGASVLPTLLRPH